MADNVFEDLVPANASAATDNDAPPDNVFEDLVPESKGLDKDRPVQSVPGMDWAGSILHGMNKANPLVMAPKAGAWLANKALTATGVQPQDNEQIYKDIDNLVTPNPVGDTTDKVLSGAGEMAMTVPDTGVALKGIASKLPGVASSLDRGLLARMAQGTKNVGGNAVREMAADPKNTAKYVAQNMGAGAGIEAAHEETKDEPWYVKAPVELAGGIAGGFGAVAPVTLPATYLKYGLIPNAVKFGGKTAFNAAIDHAPDSLAQGDGVMAKFLQGARANRQQELYDKALPMAAKQIQGVINPEAAASIDNATRLRQTIPGFNPSLAETTGLPSLVATQRGTEGSSAGNLLDNFVKRKQQSEGAISQYAEDQSPPANDVDYQSAIGRRLGNINSSMETQKTLNLMDKENLAEQLPTANPYDTGNYMRDRLESLRTDKQKEMSTLADDMGLNDAQHLRVSGAGIQKAIQSALPSRFAQDTSPTVRKILKLDPQAEPMQFKDAKYLMEQLGQEARQSAKQGNMQDARVISQARGNIDDYLTNEWAPSLGIGQKYQDWRGRYLNEYVNRFDKGATQDVRTQGSDSRYRTDNEDVAGAYFRPGNITAAKDFHTTFAGDPQASEALQGYALDDLRQKAVKDGVIDPKALGKWVTDNKDNLAQFPTLQSKVQDIQTTAQSLAERQAQLASRQEDIGNSKLAKVFGDTNTTMDTLLGDPVLLKRTVGTMGDDEKQALSRAMWQRAAQGGDTNPATMKQFLTDNDGALKTVLAPEHVQSLHDIQQAWEMNANVGTPTGVADRSVMDGFKDAIGSSPQQLLSRAFAVQSGRTGLKYTVGDLLARMGLNANQKQQTAIMQKAMYDPGFAKELSEFVKQPKPTVEKASKIKSYMYNSGISALQPDDDQSDDDTPHITITKGQGSN